MPRRRNRQLCECGCGEMTETGRFVRGHATRHRWNLIKAAELGTGLVAGPRVSDSEEVKVELNARKWAMPMSRRTFGVEFELTSTVTAQEIARALRAAGIKVSDPSGYESMSSRPEWSIKRDSSIHSRYPRFGFEVGLLPLPSCRE